MSSLYQVPPTLSVAGSKVHVVAKVFRMAMGEFYGNVQRHHAGLLEEEVPVLYAGLFYDKPWTRDTAINVWNGAGLLFPEVAKNTLLCQLEQGQGGVVIRGQYWDKIIWSVGAWHYYEVQGDFDFLNLAYTAIVNTLHEQEAAEYSEDLHLFRGASVYGDGVSAYPEIYTRHEDAQRCQSYSGIDRWPEFNPSLRVPEGGGLPMHALSTNVVYYRTYRILPLMETALGRSVDPSWDVKAANLYEAIQMHFWDDERQRYRYLVDRWGGSDAQEGMGLAFALLFDITTPEQAEAVLNHTTIEPAGIPCIYPPFERYRKSIPEHTGRHCGTIWPPIQGFWAAAALKHNRPALFDHEFEVLTRHVFRDHHFAELYHPLTGLPYGGIQEPTHEAEAVWFCGERQTWSATAYLSMVLKGLFGMHFTTDGIAFRPYLPKGLSDLKLDQLKYRDAVLNLYVQGQGSQIVDFKVDGERPKPFFRYGGMGEYDIEITVSA